jgi:putative glutamine amidotransferase
MSAAHGSGPRIGVTRGEDAVGEYLDAIRLAGGEPVELMPTADVDAVLGAVDGVLFTGGGDIDPAHFEQALHPQSDLVPPERDAFELALMRETFARRVPTLAICRGMQVANVALGGSLHQHVPDVFGERVRHRVVVDGKSVRGLIDEHVVEAEAGSLLAALAGPAFATGARHHQAVDRIAPPLRATGRTSDGVVEGLEPLAPGPFWLAVQWHPESTLALDAGASRAIFRGFLTAVARHGSNAGVR